MDGRRVGFTGTQVGGLPMQEETLRQLLRDKKPSEFHHGDCVGADAQAHQVVCGLRIDEGLTRIIPHIHPPLDTVKRAWCQWDNAIVYRPRPYLERNHAIVDATDELIAMPKGYEEELRSGTWATIRYARKQGKPVTIIWPNGSTNTTP